MLLQKSVSFVSGFLGVFFVLPPKPFSFAAVAGWWIMLQDLWDATMARLLQVPSLSN